MSRVCCAQNFTVSWFCICFFVFPMNVNGNTEVEVKWFLFVLTGLFIVQFIKSHLNLSSNSALRVWSSVLKTVQFYRQNLYSTIFCNFAVLQRFFFSRFFISFNLSRSFRESFVKCFSQFRVNNYFGFLELKFYLKKTFLENAGSWNMPLATVSWWWQTVNNRKCGFPLRKLLSIDDLNSYQREQKRVKAIIIITPHNAPSLTFA